MTDEQLLSINLFLDESHVMWTASQTLSVHIQYYGLEGPYLEPPCCLGPWAKDPFKMAF